MKRLFEPIFVREMTPKSNNPRAVLQKLMQKSTHTCHRLWHVPRMKSSQWLKKKLFAVQSFACASEKEDKKRNPCSWPHAPLGHTASETQGRAGGTLNSAVAVTVLRLTHERRRQPESESPQLLQAREPTSVGRAHRAPHGWLWEWLR